MHFRILFSITCNEFRNIHPNLVSVLVSVTPRFATSRHASARLNPLPETTAPAGGGSGRARPPRRDSDDLAPSTSRLTGIRLKSCSPYNCLPAAPDLKTASQPLPAVKLRGDRRPPRPIPYAAELLAFITPFSPTSLWTRGLRKNKPTPIFLQQHKQISASLNCLQDDCQTARENRGGGGLVK